MYEIVGDHFQVHLLHNRVTMIVKLYASSSRSLMEIYGKQFRANHFLREPLNSPMNELLLFIILLFGCIIYSLANSAEDNWIIKKSRPLFFMKFFFLLFTRRWIWGCSVCLLSRLQIYLKAQFAIQWSPVPSKHAFLQYLHCHNEFHRRS